MIEDDAAFGWMRAMGRGTPPGANEHSTNEPLLAVLMDAQARQWREMTGEPVRGTLVPFGAPVPPAAPKKAPKANTAP